MVKLEEKENGLTAYLSGDIDTSYSRRNPGADRQ